MKCAKTLGTSALLITCASFASAQQEVATLSGTNAGDQFGFAIAFVGDVDNDGHEDFAVGAPRANSIVSLCGAVTVYSGRTMGVLHTWFGVAQHDYYGAALAAAGDVDLDGFDDVLVGAPRGVAWFSPQLGGYVEIRSGSTGAILRTLTVPSSPPGFGAAVAGGNDVDGDSIPDVLVGAPGGPGGYGAAYLFAGSTGALLRTHIPSEAVILYHSGPTLGYSVAFLGDIDGDGRAEYALGAPAEFSLQPSYVQVFDGALGTSLWRTSIITEDEEFGWSLARIDDLEGDGVPDLVAGARQHGSFGPSFGRVRVLSGASGAIVADYGQGLGASQHSGLGFAVAAVGDLDGDGLPEFAAGAPSDEPLPVASSHARAVRVWSINSAPALVVIPPSTDPLDAFGMAIASGDANGDGLHDLLVGEPFDDSNGAERGSVHVYTYVRAPTVYCEAQVNSQGCTPAIASNGSASATQLAAFDIRASNVINQTSGILFYGSTPLASPHLGGTLCVHQPVRRTAVQNTGGNLGGPDCSGTLSFDFNAHIRSGVDPALNAGDEVFAQYWSRDASFVSTTNLTDALAFFVKP